ncbi:hypothetical protein MEO39_05115 [Dolichospermum sp. ST_sed2]|nr:hypothetical protein [Dolichospermum sp. ST_sed10]MDD1445388.1 hypothetical protein [Dolichospermum sp. ST_sed8]MDD1459476.1 hypothetical protein [Dolichospermum sp. ST_sed2]
MKIGLRRIYNYESKHKYFLITVIDPKKNITQIRQKLNGVEWVYVTYPQDFKTAGTLSARPFSLPGTYTIIWETENLDMPEVNNGNWDIFQKASTVQIDIKLLKIIVPDLYTGRQFLTCHQFEIINYKKEQN